MRSFAQNPYDLISTLSRIVAKISLDDEHSHNYAALTNINADIEQRFLIFCLELRLNLPF